MAKKCGSCQKKRMAKRLHAPGSSRPLAAAQPIIGGSAPGIAPTSVFAVLMRLSGVCENVNDDGGGSERGAEQVAGEAEISDAGDREQAAGDESASRQHPASG